MSQTAIAKRSNLKTLMEAQVEKFGDTLPTNINPKKFVNVALTAINSNVDLSKCTTKSIMTACMMCAKDGLVPDGREAALIPYKDAATYMPMVGGYIKKIYDTGRIKVVDAQIVRQGDIDNGHFQYWVDEHGNHFRFEPPMFADRGEPVGVFAYAVAKDGAMYFEHMSLDEIEQVRQCSRSPGKGPWKDWWSEKAKAACIKRLAKRMPILSEIQSVIEHDNDQHYELEPEDRQPLPRAAGQPSRLKSLVGTASEPVEPEDDGPPVEMYEAEVIEQGEPGEDRDEDDFI